MSLANWNSLFWTFTPVSFTESSTTGPTPRTARLDRLVTGGSRVGFFRGGSGKIWPFVSNPISSLRRRRAEKQPAVLQRARSRSWHPARHATPSSAETATSCDLNGLPVTQCHAPGSGRGLGLGQASGTEQQHPTPLLKRKKKKKRRRGERRTGGGEWSPWHNHVGLTYIFITLSHTIFILNQKRGWAKEEQCVCGRGGAKGIGTSIEVFLLLFFGGCKYVCATLDSQCWSKLNPVFFFSFILFLYITLHFYFILWFFVCLFFEGKKRKEKQNRSLTHSGCAVLICG